MPIDFISNFLSGIVDFIAANPAFAGFICFFVAMGEALFLIGLFFPSTVVLVGAGTLIGLGELDFWPLFIWTTAGAVTGDAISYWVGYTFKGRLRNIWPLNKYPEWLQKGEDYFAQHGGKSIFIGRFVPGVKSVVPGIAGMADMNFIRFSVFNVSSAFAWSALHLVPGVMAGSALFAVGEINTRLAIALGGLCVAIFIAVVLVRWFVLFILPIFGGTHQALVNWFASRPDRPSQWIAKTYDTDNPRSVGMLVSAVVLLVLLPLFFWFIGNVTPGMTMVRADLAINNFFELVRSPKLDAIMIPVYLLGSGFVVLCVSLSAGIYLILRKAWRRGIGLLITIGSSAVFVMVMKSLFSRGHNIDLSKGPDYISLSSGHATITTVLVGTIAVLIAHERSRKIRALVFSLAASYAILVGFARIYLGVHWTSDVLAGLIFGAALVSVFAFIFGHIHNEKIGRNALAAITIGACTIAGFWYVPKHFENTAHLYQPHHKVKALRLANWLNEGWEKLPMQRVSLSGELEEDLILQWFGKLSSLQDSLSQQGWQAAASWNIPSFSGYLEGQTPITALPPVPHTHMGYLPALVMVRQIDKEHRQVLWIWTTQFKIQSEDDKAAPLYVGALQQEKTLRPFGELSALTQEKTKPNVAALLKFFPGALLHQRTNGVDVILAGDKPIHR
ncbi:bifunctional DedA family/phosphatase PAP2 family protein [Polycladidibacter stylochi]|uniref:bifunctional DedA family/phosphatase PAP2 family protein n=1 Tax=Polycladidibacter stylochi TaxID=1807766 RepID=UPI000835FC5D|nr:bifunctional DedA family/phosphatase PAP2 family protein [Pseudovibrio stylochi]